MTYVQQIINNRSIDNELAYEQVYPRVFFQKDYDIKRNVLIPLSKVIETIGKKEDIETITDNLRNWTKNNHRNMAVVSCYIKQDEIVKDEDTQKLLDFSICDTVTGASVIFGEILFHHGKVSFHT